VTFSISIIQSIKVSLLYLIFDIKLSKLYLKQVHDSQYSNIAGKWGSAN